MTAPTEYDAMLIDDGGGSEGDNTSSSNGEGDTPPPSKLATLRILPLREPTVPLHEEISPADMATTFLQDLQHLTPGSVPHSVMVGFSIGVFCGLVAYVYYFLLEELLELLWHTIPERYIEPHLPEAWHWIWIPLLGWIMAVGVGASVLVLGEPGDLSYTVQCVHDKAYIGMDHVLPMLLASQFSILGGGSLGPEAPLVAICARCVCVFLIVPVATENMVRSAVGGYIYIYCLYSPSVPQLPSLSLSNNIFCDISFSGYISRKVFKQTRMNIIRKHTLMGMACALAAFFGVPLGGSLFALEINNRFGIEYYEHTMEAIFSGTVCLCVFRGLSRLDMGSIWTISPHSLEAAAPVDVAVGAAIGLLGAGVAALFAAFHQRVVMAFFRKYHLLRNDMAVRRALVGATGMLLVGVLIPQTMFWGEAEFQTISTASPAKELPHVFPTSGLLNFEMNTFWACMLVGTAKIVAISFTVAAGYRGGFIFPFFAAGAAFGNALVYLFPSLSPITACLCFAAGINVAITRTALASTLILAALAGEGNAISPLLAASIASLFATSYMPFIRSQVKRADIGRFAHDKYNTIPSGKTEGEGGNGYGSTNTGDENKVSV